MKPRTFTIIAVVLAVIGVASYAAGHVMSGRVDDALRRIEIVEEQHGSLVDLDEAEKARVLAELEDAKLMSGRSRLLKRLGFGALLLAYLANAMRVRSKRKAAGSSAARPDGTSAGAEPPITTNA